jgi:hypothetical protein
VIDNATDNDIDSDINPVDFLKQIGCNPSSKITWTTALHAANKYSSSGVAYDVTCSPVCTLSHLDATMYIRRENNDALKGGCNSLSLSPSA